MKYKFNSSQQITSGIVSALTTFAVTYLFDHEIKWALGIAVGIGMLITSGFYSSEKR